MIFKKIAIILSLLAAFSISDAQIVIKPNYGHHRLAKVTVTLQLPTTAMDNTPLTNSYTLKDIEIYFSSNPIVCDTTAVVCNIKPTVILYPQNNSIPTSYTYVGLPFGNTVYVRADACNVNGCSYLSNQLSVTNNLNYSLTIKGNVSIKETIKTDAPPEAPVIIITMEPE